MFSLVLLADSPYARDMTKRAGLGAATPPDRRETLADSIQGTGPANETAGSGGRPGRIRRLPFDAASVELIAETLGVSVQLADFQLPGATVFQLVVPGANERPAAMITLWPSLRRVDVIGGSATVVFTTVATVDLVTDIEVQFRRATNEYLIVARGGKVIVRA